MSDMTQFKSAIDGWLVSSSKLAVGVARGISIEMLEYAATFSPQFSGDMAGNWKYSVGVPDTSFDELDLLDQAHTETNSYIMGMMPAINHTMQANVGKDKAFNTLGQVAYISNTAYHDEYYAWLVEEDRIKFRDGNMGHVAQRTINKMQERLPVNIGKVLAQNLASKTIGGWV
jgi:hypothetical protein